MPYTFSERKNQQNKPIKENLQEKKRKQEKIDEKLDSRYLHIALQLPTIYMSYIFAYYIKDLLMKKITKRKPAK